MDENKYYERLAAAYVRGKAERAHTQGCLPEPLLEKPLRELTDEELKQILAAGRSSEDNLYAFKRTHGDLLRVRRVLGFLRSLQIDSLLDVGSGRGVFLFPFLEEFPWVRVTSMDILPHRIERLQALRRGGAGQLEAVQADICTQPFADNSFDVVTMLEVLEHIPDVGAAVRAAVHMAKKYVVVTVPSKPDNNPEHIHLLTKARLTELFQAAGCDRLRFDGVLGHLVLIVVIDGDNGLEEVKYEF